MPGAGTLPPDPRHRARFPTGLRVCSRRRPGRPPPRRAPDRLVLVCAHPASFSVCPDIRVLVVRSRPTPPCWSITQRSLRIVGRPGSVGCPLQGGSSGRDRADTRNWPRVNFHVPRGTPTLAKGFARRRTSQVWPVAMRHSEAALVFPCEVQQCVLFHQG